MTTYPEALLRVRALPLEAGLSAVGDELWPDATAVRTVPILGGLGSAVDRVTVSGPDGADVRYVLRRQVPEWQGDVSLEREVLDALVAHGAPVPAARWADPSGEVFGVPAILLDHVAGDLVSASRAPARLWRMGAALAAVHAIPPDAWPASMPVPEGSLAERLAAAREERLRPERVERSFVDAVALWDALETAAPHVDVGPLVLLHDDYHPGNVLDDGERTTIIDWGYPVAGHAGLDLGYATMDLAMTGDDHLSGSLLDGYASAAGSLPPDLWFWQIVAVERSLPSPVEWLPGYRDQGHPELTVETLEHNGRRFLRDALAQGRAAGVLGTLDVRETTLERDA